MRDDNMQMKQEQEEHQQWEEMQAELEKYVPFKRDFEKFIAPHENTAADGFCTKTPL